MGTACPHYQPSAALRDRVTWRTRCVPLLLRRTRLPLGVTAVAAMWSIYWLPWLPQGLFRAAKYGLLFVMVALLVPAVRRSVGVLRGSGRSTILWLAALAGVTVLGVASSPEPMRSFQTWVRYPMALLLYVGLRHLYERDPRRIAWAIRLLPVSVLASVAYVYLAKLGLVHAQPPESFVRAYRSEAYLMGLSYRTSGLSWAIAFVAPVMVFYSLRAFTLLRRRLWLAGLLVCICTNFLLMNRGGLISMLLGSALVAFVGLRRPVARGALLAVLLPAVIYGASRFYASERFEHKAAAWREVLAGRATAATWDKLSSHRVSTYGAAFRIVAGSPLMGIGFAEVDDVYDLSSSQAHNLYLNVALGAGALAGALVLLFFIFKVGLPWLRALRTTLRGRGHPFLILPVAMMLPHLVATLVESGPMFTSLYSGITFWFALPAMEILLRSEHAGLPEPARADGPQGE